MGEALNEELGQFGVDVTVLSPGLTKTAMTDDAAIDFGKLPVSSMSPDAVAKIGFARTGKKANSCTRIHKQSFHMDEQVYATKFPCEAVWNTGSQGNQGGKTKRVVNGAFKVIGAVQMLPHIWQFRRIMKSHCWAIGLFGNGRYW